MNLKLNVQNSERLPSVGGGVTLERKINDQQGRNVNVSYLFYISVQYSVFHQGLVIRFVITHFYFPFPSQGLHEVGCGSIASRMLTKLYNSSKSNGSIWKMLVPTISWMETTASP